MESAVVQASKTFTRNISHRMDTWLDRIERHSFLLVTMLLSVYGFILVIYAGTHRLWYDELHTYYFADLSSLAHLMDAISRYDFNPPLIYLATRLSHELFGKSELATRVPSLIGMLVASICIYLFVRRRIGVWYGLLTLAILWFSPFAKYAAEARPYALLLGFLGMAMVAWQRALEESGSRGPWLCLMATGILGMLMSHVFGSVYLAGFAVAEGVRLYQRRRPDWPLYLTVLAPLLSLAIYLPLIQNFTRQLFPPAFQASLGKVYGFYAQLAGAMGWGLLLSLTLALTVSVIMRQSGEQRPKLTLNAPELGFLAGLGLLPLLINLALMVSQGAFWDRYAIGSVVAVSVALTALVAAQTGSSRAAAITMLAVLVPLTVAHFPPTPQQIRAFLRPIPKGGLESIRPDLPMVTAGGTAFIELHAYEKPALLSRLFYLRNREAAIRYAHATAFEFTVGIERYIPIQGRFMQYDDFVIAHPHFIVLGRPDYPEHWLLDKLIADGAIVRYLGDTPLSRYGDKTLFEVWMANAPNVPSQ